VTSLSVPIKTVIRALLHPLRAPITWACQRGFLSSEVRNFLPWRWALEPFTIYGSGWKCRWFPAEFDDIAAMVFWSGFRRWEKETAPIILDNIRRSRCFMDVGANCGIYTVLGAVINPGVRVVAIEPVPKICAALTRNVAQNKLHPRVTILNVAAGDANAVVDFHEAENPLMGSLSVSGYRGQTGTVIRVQCRTLDSVVEELSIEPDFIKIDVEGFEDVVLRGARQLLRKFHPRIVLEANPGDPCRSVTEILAANKYAFHLITDEGPEWREEITPVAEYRNWLCLPTV
jgi:FkbM family methyltransferase